MPELASSTLKPDGGLLLSPELRDPAEYAYRIVLEGVCRNRYNGVEFDALYQADSSGAFTVRHNYLDWTPRPPALESEDAARHRYVFRVPAEWGLRGRSVGVRVNLDRFVEQFLIPPSEVRAAMSGEMRMTVMEMPLRPGFPWTAVLGAGLPAVLAVGGVGWVLRRRMRWGHLSPDLRAALERIEQKCRVAQAAVSREHDRLLPVKDRLAALRAGAFSLARQAQELRNTRQLADREALETAISSLQRQLPLVNDPAVQQEVEVTLKEKRKTLDLLKEIEQAESRCMMRLAKIEAVADLACLSLRSVRIGTAAPMEEALCRELDAEVSAIREVAEQAAACEALTAQVQSLRLR
jgi:hypothetical protein